MKIPELTEEEMRELVAELLAAATGLPAEFFLEAAS